MNILYVYVNQYNMYHILHKVRIWRCGNLKYSKLIYTQHSMSNQNYLCSLYTLSCVRHKRYHLYHRCLHKFGNLKKHRKYIHPRWYWWLLNMRFIHSLIGTSNIYQNILKLICNLVHMLYSSLHTQQDNHQFWDHFRELTHKLCNQNTSNCTHSVVTKLIVTIVLTFTSIFFGLTISAKTCLKIVDC